MPEIKLIAAIDSKRGIAIGQKLPWHLPVDQRYFQEKLKDGPVVMGWNTFAANGFRPYGLGSNIVITHRDAEAIPGTWIVHDAHDYFKNAQEDVWVAGGGEIFSEAMPYATMLYITQLAGDFGADIFFPEYESTFHRIDNNRPQIENGITFTFQIWARNR